MISAEENDRSVEEGFKVEDRRLFTPDGKLRAGALERPKAVKTPKPPEPGAGNQPERRPATHPAFVNLVEFLAGNTLVHLGMGPEGTLGGPTDLRTARHLADMLEVLLARTRGRVSEEEERLLEERLYEIQMVFVEKSRAPARK